MCLDALWYLFYFFNKVKYLIQTYLIDAKKEIQVFSSYAYHKKNYLTIMRLIEKYIDSQLKALIHSCQYGVLFLFYNFPILLNKQIYLIKYVLQLCGIYFISLTKQNIRFKRFQLTCKKYKSLAVMPISRELFYTIETNKKALFMLATFIAATQYFCFEKAVVSFSNDSYV